MLFGVGVATGFAGTIFIEALIGLICFIVAFKK